MRLWKVWNLGGSMVAAVAAWIPAAYAQPCGSNGLEESITGTSLDGVDYTVYYSNNDWLDCNVVGEYLPTNVAQKLDDMVNETNGRHKADWGFEVPWISTLPDFGISAFASGGSGFYTGSCVYVDSTSRRCASDDGLRWVIGHETFHGIQRRYVENAAVEETGSYGAWFTEGTARCLDDRYNNTLDAYGPHYVEVDRLMRTDHDDLGPFRDLSLTDLSYRATVWWSYCCEQLGSMQFEPDNGVDFIRELWENCEEDLVDFSVKDGIAAADRTIDELGGGSMRALFLDYAICLYTREFDVSALPNAGRYNFIDETPAGLNGGDRYPDMTRFASADGAALPADIDVGEVPNWGQRLLELTNIQVPGTGVCECIGMSGQADQDVAWSLVGVKAPAGAGLPERATVLSKSVGKNYIRTFLHTFNSPFTRIGTMIAGTRGAADVEVKFDRGQAGITIQRPTSDKPVYPGPFNAAGRFLARVKVSGPDSLKPFEQANVSVTGLVTEDFAAKVGTANATILNAGYVGGEYWLVIQAPNQAADGAYDLTVQICPTSAIPATDINVTSVIYGTFTVNHMLVMDRSGSMAYPDDGTGSKLDAAKNAATLYIDAVNDSDRVGFAWLSGNAAECDDDASTPVVLATANAGQRTAARNAVNGLTPDGWTSIGDGLWDGQDQIDLLPAGPGQINTIVLLSDGEENEARFWDSTLNCGGGDLGNSARSRIEPTDTTINSIAFGPESNQALMQSIGTQTDGDYSYVDVTEGGRGAGLSESSILADAYMKMLQRARKLERLFFHAGNAAGGAQTARTIPVNEGGVDRATLFVNWPAGAGAVTVELRDPSNSVIGAGQATVYTTSTHKVYHLNGTMATGNWSVRITPTNDTEFIVGLLGRQRNGVQLIAEVSQHRTGGTGAGPNLGKFEHGVPVIVVAIPTDTRGRVTGAQINATVTRPDGSTACGNLVLRDDGTSEDGEADDGVYAGVFTDVSQAGTQFGVINDNPGNPNPGGQRGTYRVHVTATGLSNVAEPFNRAADAYFHMFTLSINDIDFDGMPGTWERYYGTNPFANDAGIDFDRDGLTHVQEFQNGTNPFDQDSDHGGENDGSEVAGGRCPIDPTDDALPCPMDVGVINEPGDHDTDILIPLGNVLRFPVHPTYASMRIYRADEGNPGFFSLLAEPALSGPNDGTYADTDLVDGQTYYYRFQAKGPGGALSCLSPVVRGTARLDPAQPLGEVTINSSSERTDSTDVLISLNLRTTADKFRVSNFPIDGTEPLHNIPATPHFNWMLNAPSAGRRFTHVYVQFLNTTAGTFSEKYAASILFDPAGDFDADTVANALDPDDDADGLPDFDEIFVWHTDAYETDSDEDGLFDGDEVSAGCTHPRNPDSDGDGVLDGADPSPSGDTDGDGDVDLADVAQFMICFTGEDGGPVLAVCACLDVDGDDDIDLADYEAFSAGIVGP